MAHPQSAQYLRAAYEGNTQLVRQMLRDGVPVDCTHPSGLQALHFAAKTGNTELAGQLIKHGAKVDAKTQKGNTPLHVAALLGKSEFVKLLLKYHTEVNALSTCNEDNFSPLYMAAQIGHQEIVTLLLANGADPELTTKNGSTAKQVAYQQGHKAVGELLEQYEQRIAETKLGQSTPTESLSNGDTSKSENKVATKKSDSERGAVGGPGNNKGGKWQMSVPPTYDDVLPSPKCSPRKAAPRKGSFSTLAQ